MKKCSVLWRKRIPTLKTFGKHASQSTTSDASALYVGKDGNNRAAMWSFGTATGRNNPKARAFLLSRPHWVRNLVTPREGYAIVHGDIVGAESWLAAGICRDPELMRIYSSGADQYIEFAMVTGALPPGSTRDKSNREMERIRAMHKTALFAINYGVQSKTLALYLGVPEWKAAAIINAHKAAYLTSTGIGRRRTSRLQRSGVTSKHSSAGAWTWSTRRSTRS